MKIDIDVDQIIRSAEPVELHGLAEKIERARCHGLLSVDRPALKAPAALYDMAMVEGLARAAAIAECAQGPELADSIIAALRHARRIGLLPVKAPAVNLESIESPMHGAERREAAAAGGVDYMTLRTALKRKNERWTELAKAHHELELKAMNAAAELAATKSELGRTQTAHGRAAMEIDRCHDSMTTAWRENDELKARIELLTNADAER